MRRVTDIGILCAGRSLTRLPEIVNNFSHCFIINLWESEGLLLAKYINEKDITYMLNADQQPWKEHKHGGVVANKCFVVWTKAMVEGQRLPSVKRLPAMKLEGAMSALAVYRTVMSVSYLPDKYGKTVMRIRNTGLTCIHYVSEELMPDRVWIVGLDFYSAPYLSKAYHPKGFSDIHKSKIARGWIDELVGHFLDTVKQYPKIQFKIVTEYKKLPKLFNLEVL